MARSFAAPADHKGPPTLWPLRSAEWTSLRDAIQACERENRALKILAVDLSELILGL